LLNDSLRISAVVDHLNFTPEVTTHFFSTLLHLVTGKLHHVTHILKVSLNNDLDVFLALINRGCPLKLFVLLFEDQILLVLLRLNDRPNSLIRFLLQLDPLVGRLLHKYLPHPL